MTRLTFVGTVYYQPFGQQAHAVKLDFQRSMRSDEQRFERTMSVGEDWMQIERGWLSGELGFLVITNEEGKFAFVQPTDEERAAADAKVVEVKFSGGGILLVGPHESLPCRPATPEGVELRCQSGTARVTVRLYAP